MTARNKSLDVLRGLAVLLVIGRHLDYYRVWHKVGWCGVDLFFVLSGFLISGLLFQEYKATGAINFHRFILRRGLKIWPPLYAFLGIFFGIALAQHDSLFRFAYPALFVSNYFMPPLLFGHLWSLAVEEHFYILLPLLLILLSKNSRLHWIPNIYLALATVCFMIRYFSALPTDGTFVSTHTRMDGLFCGVAIGYLYHFKSECFKSLSSHRLMVVAVSLCSVPLFVRVDTRFMQTFGLLSLSVGFALVLAWSLERECPLWLHPISEVGRYSYSIYLWQMPVAFLLAGRTFISFWLALVVSVLLGIIMGKLVEFPALRLRNRWIPSPSARSGNQFFTATETAVYAPLNVTLL